MSVVRETPERRRFLRTSVAGGCFLLCPLQARRGAAEGPTVRAFDEKISYCCARCTPESCEWLSTDIEVKRKKAAELERKLGRKILPDEITCSRCRVDEGSALESIRRCPIRRCALDRKVPSCAHCAELPGCKRANPLTRESALAIRQELLALSQKEVR
jgi:hypothetical protein